MHIRVAGMNDTDALYALGLTCPELQTNPTQPFMELDEFRWSIENPCGVFMLAEYGDEIIGFVYVNMRDMERPMPDRWACLVYLAVKSENRSGGIATQLYETAITRLRKQGVTRLYGWAHVKEASPIEAFLNRHGFESGGLYRWYDRQI